MHPFIKITRPLNSLMAAFGAFIGYCIASGNIGLNIDVFAAMLAAFFVSAGGMVINDYFDRDLDRTLRPDRPIPRGEIHAGTALMLAILFFLVGNSFASLINLPALVIALGFSISLIYYSAMLREHKYIGNWVVASATGFTFIFGAAAYEISPAIIIFAAAALFANVSREIGKDFEDLKNDLGFKKTLPMILPEKLVMFLVAVFLLVSMFLVYLPFTMYGFGNIYFLAIVTLSNILFLAALAAMYFRRFGIFSALSKFAMFVALIGFLSGILK